MIRVRSECVCTNYNGFFSSVFVCHFCASIAENNPPKTIEGNKVCFVSFSFFVLATRKSFNAIFFSNFIPLRLLPLSLIFLCSLPTMPILNYGFRSSFFFLLTFNLFRYLFIWNLLVYFGRQQCCDDPFRWDVKIRQRKQKKNIKQMRRCVGNKI